jgi:hypothetical protein
MIRFLVAMITHTDDYIFRYRVPGASGRGWPSAGPAAVFSTRNVAFSYTLQLSRVARGILCTGLTT